MSPRWRQRGLVGRRQGRRDIRAGDRSWDWMKPRRFRGSRQVVKLSQSELCRACRGHAAFSAGQRPAFDFDLGKCALLGDVVSRGLYPPRLMSAGRMGGARGAAVVTLWCRLQPLCGVRFSGWRQWTPHGGRSRVRAFVRSAAARSRRWVSDTTLAVSVDYYLNL